MSHVSTSSVVPPTAPWAWARALAAPVFIVMILAMMVLPLPAWALDGLFSLNIALALVVMMVAAGMRRPLDFAALPGVLLVTTLLRLSLNVASTRVVLLEGHTGPDAAGQVIQAFGQFLVGGNFTVGLLVFAVLVVINFVVVTQGAQRIAEVAARFTLDAMPGKQMAIDADLNAGHIDAATARRRRAEVSEEADFFGAMDGASKYVRGDAMAALLILLINAFGGLGLGMLQHGLGLGEAADHYFLLAVGDALAAQIPALLISVSAAVVVSRVGKEQDLGAQIGTQIFAAPRALTAAGLIVSALGWVPGMPLGAFMTVGLALLGLAAFQAGRTARPSGAEVEAAGAAAGVGAGDGAGTAAGPNTLLQDAAASTIGGGALPSQVQWQELRGEDALGLELGLKLVPLVDAQRGGELLAAISGLRRQFAQEQGFVPPTVQVRDNATDLGATAYRVRLRGVVIGEGEAFAGQFLAINPGTAQGSLPGHATTEPAFGLPAFWITAATREAAQKAGFTVVDCASALATHLAHLMQLNAARLLGRSETQAWLEHAKRQVPGVLDDAAFQGPGTAAIQKILQGLLDEGVPIRDMRSITESLAAHDGAPLDPAERLRALRLELAPAIVQQCRGASSVLEVFALNPELEQQWLGDGQTPPLTGLDAGRAAAFLREAAQSAQAQAARGLPACLLVPDALRAALAQLLKRQTPRLYVLSHSEVACAPAVRIGAWMGAAA